LGAKGTGVTGIFGILLCLEQPVQYVIEMLIAVGVAFAISFILYKDQTPEANAAGQPGAENGGSAAGISTADISAADQETEQKEDRKEGQALSEEELMSPADGKVIPLTEVSDETFASEMLGTTVAVEPATGK